MNIAEMIKTAEKYMDQTGGIKDYPVLLKKLENMPYYEDPHSSDFIDDLLEGRSSLLGKKEAAHSAIEEYPRIFLISLVKIAIKEDWPIDFLRREYMLGIIEARRKRDL